MEAINQNGFSHVLALTSDLPGEASGKNLHFSQRRNLVTVSVDHGNCPSVDNGVSNMSMPVFSGLITIPKGPLPFSL